MMSVESAVETMVCLWLQDDELELEGSLGVAGDHGRGYKPGVPFDHFEKVFNALSGVINPKWSNGCVHSKTMTVLYDKDIRGLYTPDNKPVFQRKVLIQQVTTVTNDHKHYIRISLKREIPVVPTFPLHPVKLFRIQERWSFCYNNECQYDLTKVGQGTTKESACTIDNKKFEIELELAYSSKWKAIAPANFALTLIERLIDLVGRYDEFGTEYEPITVQILHQVPKMPISEIQ
jgi:hypothetical protein